MRLSPRCPFVFLPLLVACATHSSTTPEAEHTGGSSEAINAEQSIKSAQYTLTLKNVTEEAVDLKTYQPYTDYLAIGASVNTSPTANSGGANAAPTLNAPMGCTLAVAQTAPDFNSLIGNGDTAEDSTFAACVPQTQTLGFAGNTPSQTVTVANETDVVTFGVSLDNIEKTAAATVGSSALSQAATLGGQDAKTVGTIGGIAVKADTLLEGAGAVLAGWAGLFSGIGEIGGAVLMAASLLPNTQNSQMTCAGGLVGLPASPWAMVMPVESNWSAPNGSDGSGWYAMPKQPFDTFYLQYSVQQLEAMTAAGPVDIAVPLSIQWPSTKAGSSDPIVPWGDWPGACNSRHTVTLTLSRVAGTGPAADPLSSSTAVTRETTEVDAIVADQRMNKMLDVQLTPSGWRTSTVTPSVYGLAGWTPSYWGGWTPTATLSRPQPPASNTVTLSPPVLNANGTLTTGTGTTNLVWGIDSFWFDVSGNLNWTSYTDATGWVTTTPHTTAGVPSSRLTATTRTPESMDVFWAGSGGTLQDLPYALTWTPTGTVGSMVGQTTIASGLTPGGGVAAVSRSYESSDVVYIGADGAFYDASYNPTRTAPPAGWTAGSTAGWAISPPLGGAGLAPPGASITAVARDASTVDAFYIGTSGQVYWSHYASAAINGVNGGTWTAPQPLTGFRGTPGAPITSVSRGEGMIDVVYTNGTALDMVSYDVNGLPGWTAQAAVPLAVNGFVFAPTKGDISLVAPDMNHLALVFQGEDGNNDPAMNGATWNSQAGVWTVTDVNEPVAKWAGWDTLNGGLVTDPAIAAINATELIAAATGPDGNIWYRLHDASTEAWGAWISLHYDVNAFADPPAVVAMNGKIEVFVRDPVSGHLLQEEGICASTTSCEAPVWNADGWDDVGGPILPGAPTVIVSETGAAPNLLFPPPPATIDVFATFAADGSARMLQGTGYGAMGSLISLPLNGKPVYGWTTLTGAALGHPGAASWGAGRLDVFVRGLSSGAASALWHSASTDNGQTWSSETGTWEDRGGSITSAPSVVSTGANRLDVFASGADGFVDHLAWNGTAWNKWDTVPGVSRVEGRPIAIAYAGGIDVFSQDSSNALYDTTMTGDGSPSTWSSPAMLATCFRAGGTPAVVSADGVNLDLVVTAYASNGDASLWHESTVRRFLGQDTAIPPRCEYGVNP